MNTLRCFLFAAVVIFSSATLALGGIMQTPGHSDPPPPPPASATTESPTDHMTPPPTGHDAQIAWQNLAKAMLMEILLTTY